jgi:hypothetical protein
VPIVAQKRDSKHPKPSAADRRNDAAAEREFGAAARAYEKQEKLEKARRKEQRAQQPVPASEPLPVHDPSAMDLAESPLPPAYTLPSKREVEAELRREIKEPNRPKQPAALKQTGVSSKSTVSRIPWRYKEPFSDPNRAMDPKKVGDRAKLCRRLASSDHPCEHPTLRNQFRFPIKPDKNKRGPIVKDALGQTIGRLALTMPAEVRPGVKRQVPQQISINKNEGQMLRVRGRLVKYEMSPGLLLTNGQHVSGLVPRTAISHPPLPERPKRSPAAKEPTIAIPITGGNPLAFPPKLMGSDSQGRPVPLKFRDPKSATPRGYKGEHREGNDYLPRLINDQGPLNTNYFINLIGNKLPGGGGGGIARTVIKIDRNDKTPPVFEAYTNRPPILRKLYLPGRAGAVGSLLFIPGRLRGAGSDLGTIYIAAPNLLHLPPPPKKR